MATCLLSSLASVPLNIGCCYGVLEGMVLVHRSDEIKIHVLPPHIVYSEPRVYSSL